MRRSLAFLLLCFPIVLLASSCGGEPADEPVGEASAEASAPLSDIPEAQAAYDESLELWGTDNPASVAKLHEAIAFDPDFLDAHALLAYRYAWIHQNWDRSDSIAENALGFAENAADLAPDSEGALSAMGAYYYRVRKDYPRALEIYSRATELYPENLHFLRMQAHVARRRGDWAQALDLLDRAEAVSPTLDAITAIAENHYMNRRWEAARAAYQEHARRAPESTVGPSNLAWLAFDQTGDTGPVREFLATRPSGWSLQRWNLEMLDRDFEAALAVMDASTTEVFNWQQGLGPRAMYRGIALRELGRETEAMEAFQEARGVMEAMLPDLEDDCRVHGALGEIYALLGMREEAVRAARRAVEVLPPEKDAYSGPHNVAALARVYSIVGDADAAVEQLEYLLSIPSPITRWGLRSAPVWDNIRDHPSFQALLES